MISPNSTLFDVHKAKLAIEKGKRSKWWRRMGSMSRGFYYVASDGGKINDPEHVERIQSLVIPPAWKNVRISPTQGGRLQAVGMDTTGRVQYLYHPRFSAKQQEKKFSRIEIFGKHLPKLRQITNEHISLDGFPKEKVLAVMLRLINSLYFRLGTEKSVKHYRTYGITTLQNKHLSIGRGSELVFEFVGKSHVKHRKVLVDKELSSLMKEIKALGTARKLFQYVGDDGKARGITPSELNGYLKAATAPEYSSKDLRTWGASVLAAALLADVGVAETEAERKKNLVSVIKKVADSLGNTPSVCRASYIHPAVIVSYENSIIAELPTVSKRRSLTKIQPELEPEENALLKLFADYHGGK